MEERMSFLVRLRDGERLTDLCREFGISRKTAYKFVSRYEQDGALGLVDRRRVPQRIRHRTSEAVITLIVELRRKHSTWGPRKLQEVLRTKHPDVRIPAMSTIGDILVRKGMIVRKRRRKSQPMHYPTLSTPTAPNDLWCIDFKGQFRMGDGRYCYPLTVTDAATRYILVCDAFERIDGDDVRDSLEHLFKTVGLPKAIRFDGGAPFASQGLMRLSRLSAWWLSLGIKLEQIEPASPQQNGRHERMHRTLKAETTRPPAARLLQQQERFDKWVEVFNHERPHEALGMKRPAELYVVSPRRFAPRPAHYPLHDLVCRVSSSGRVHFPNTRRGDKHYFISEALVGHELGLRELDDGRWLVSFYDVDLGTIDRITQEFTPGASSENNVSALANEKTVRAKGASRTISRTKEAKQTTTKTTKPDNTKGATKLITRTTRKATTSKSTTTPKTKGKNEHATKPSKNQLGRAA
jgi:transposase InsO family protein